MSETCHGSTVYVTHIYDGENVVRGGEDGQLWIATFANERQAEAFAEDCKRSAFLIRGIRPAVSGS